MLPVIFRCLQIQLLLLALSTIAFASSEETQCNFGSSPTLIKSSSQELHQYWLVKESSQLWSTSFSAENLIALATYRERIRKSGIDIDPNAALRRQRTYYTAQPEPGLKAEAKNMDLMLNGKAGVILPINCMESILFDTYYGALSEQTTNSEFMAVVLKKTIDSVPWLKIYFSTALDLQLLNQSQKKLMFPKFIDKDIRDGWRFETHLHNHSFFHGWSEQDNLKRDWGGGVSPGMSDVGFYRSHMEDNGLGAARIVNGFHTGLIGSNEFQIFQTHLK